MPEDAKDAFTSVIARMGKEINNENFSTIWDTNLIFRRSFKMKLFIISAFEVNNVVEEFVSGDESKPFRCSGFWLCIKQLVK
ncbi:hypothetical protein L1987_64839 [Smallanthus sonchifolius]|uniref:Uncharacterized protein n=1 Tax=Smallanthus sonchifolius TaxID=185202 RepID=A0ACB9BSS4_9ASTR|nr:hypothetical protein L1987_64839 [Smallanthus sonchifolius]